MINICFICDNNYSLATRTAINSLLQTQKEKLKIYVIGVDLSNANINSFQALSNVEVINKSNLYQNIGVDHAYVSKAALFKFMLPKILKEDKILYLDGDMIITDDISDLYNINLQDKYAAVVKDMAGMEAKHHLKMQHKAYFNSGMMLLNLNKMRKDNISEQLLEAKKNDVWKIFMDQDALNLIFSENVIYVTPRFNFMQGNMLTFSNKEIAEFYDIPEPELNTPKIYHLTNARKPWNTINCPLSELWLKYVTPDDFGVVLKKYLINQENEIKEHILRNSQKKRKKPKNLVKLIYKQVQKDNKMTYYLLGLPIYRRCGEKISILGIPIPN